MTKQILISAGHGMAIISFLQELNHFDWQKAELYGFGSLSRNGSKHNVEG